MAKDGSVIIEAEVDDSGVDRGIDEIKNKLEEASGKARDLSDSVKGFAIKAAAATVAAAGAFAVFGIKSAAEMQAMNAQFEQVFGDMQSQAQDTINEMGEKFGMLPNRIKPAMSQMTSMFKGLGMDTKDAMAAASDAVTIVADAAAFYDMSFEDANAALNSFIKGNYEGGEAIGLFANETQMASYATDKLGIDWKNATEAQKQMARLQFAQEMQKQAGATGQAARESMSLENQLGNILQATKEFSAAVMEPFLEPLVQGMSKLATSIMGAADKVREINSYFAEHKPLVAAIAILLGTLAVAIMAHNIALNWATISLTAYNVAMGVAGAVTAFFASPLVLIIGLIGILAAAFILVSGNSEWLMQKLSSLGINTENLRIFLDKLQAKVDEIKSAFGNISAMEMFKNVLRGITETAGELWGKFKDSTVFAILGVAIDSLVGKFNSIKEAIKGAFSGNFDGIANIAAGLIPMLIVNLLGGLPKLLFTGANIIKMIATGMGMTVPELVTFAGQALTDMINSIAETLPQMIEMGSQILLGFIEGITANIPALVAAITQIISGLTQAIESVLPVLISVWVLVLSAMMDGIVTALPMILGAGIQLITALIDAIIVALPIIIEVGIQIVLALLNALITALPILITAAVQIITALINGIITVLPMLIQCAVQLITALVMGLISVLPQLIQAGITLILALINAIIMVLPQLVQAGITLIIALVGAIIQCLPQLLSAGLQLILALIKGCLQVMGALIGAGIQLIVALLGAIASFLGQMLSKGKELIGKLIDGIKSKISDSVSAARDLLNRIKDTISSFSLVDVGKNLILGVATGIRNGISSVVDAAKGVISNAVEAAKNAAGIKSPSRVMRDEVGKWLSEGMALGITANTESVEGAAALLAKLAVPDMSGVEMPSARRRVVANEPVRRVQGGDVDNSKESNVTLIIESFNNYDTETDARGLVEELAWLTSRDTRGLDFE